jgi:hypothetical protein
MMVLLAIGGEYSRRVDEADMSLSGQSDKLDNRK